MIDEGQFAVIPAHSRDNCVIIMQGKRYYTLTSYLCYKRGLKHKIRIEEDVLKRLLQSKKYKDAFQNISLKKAGTGLKIVLSPLRGEFKSLHDSYVALETGGDAYKAMLNPTLYIYKKFEDQVKTGAVELKDDHWRTKFLLKNATGINHMFISEIAMPSSNGYLYFSHFTLKNGSNFCLICDTMGDAAFVANAPLLKRVDGLLYSTKSVVEYCQNAVKGTPKESKLYVSMQNSPEKLFSVLKYLGRSAAKTKLEDLA